MTAPADDIDRIMAIMACAFDPAFGEAWNRRQVEDALLIGNCHYLLVGSDGSDGRNGKSVAGFCLTRAGYEEEELLLLAVAPAYRQNGFGRILLDRFAVSARDRGASRLLLEMRKGNPAESLYRQASFVPIGERRGYYRALNGDSLDAITFERLLELT
jgi:[ribosomal protein S18]-alanine N-acetyltransferase